MGNTTMRDLKIAVPVALALLLAAGAFWMFQKDDVPSTGARGMPPTPVVVVTVEEDDFADMIEAIGTAIANESVDITAKVTDTISVINFVDGMVVEAGRILVELTEVEESAAIAEARASLSEAKKQFLRISDLVANKTASESRMDGAIAERDKAKARVDTLEAKLADRIVRAPFAGLLGLRQVSLGTLVRPGDVITTLDDIETIKIDFSIPERFLSVVAVGQDVAALSVAYPDRQFAGKVMMIDSRVDPITRSVIVRAQLPNPDMVLRPGMLMSVSVVSNQRRSLSLPEGALMQVRDEVYVWVVGEDNKPERRLIDIASRRKGFVEVVSGLTRGERVIVEGTIRVRRPGQPLKILSEEAQEPAAPSEDGRKKTKT